eukprot:2690230-Pleurochrysis_carterae.AAC.5
MTGWTFEAQESFQWHVSFILLVCTDEASVYTPRLVHCREFFMTSSWSYSAMPLYSHARGSNRFTHRGHTVRGSNC